MQPNKLNKLIAGLLAANAAKALHLGGERSSGAPATLAQVQAESAVQAQLNVAAVSQIETRTADADETDLERRQREADEKVQHIFKKILDGIEAKREEALEWLCDFGDALVEDVQDKADELKLDLSTLADNREGDMEALQTALNDEVQRALYTAVAEIQRLKAEAADGITEKRKDVMYKIKDLKIEIGTTFKKDVKADKKAKIESLVSELESFINKTIRDYDEAVDNEIARVLTTTAAAADGLVTEKADALEAYGKAKKQAIKALIALIDVKMDELADAAQEKNDAATEVHTYLTENYTRYLNELLEHIFEGSAEADRDVLIARALDPDVQKDFLDEVLRFNKELMEAMAKKLAIIKKELNNVKGGTDLKHKHTSDGRVAKDKNGEDVVTQEPQPGFDSDTMTIRDELEDALMDIQSDQDENNRQANTAVQECADEARLWLDTAASNELTILADFLEQGFAFHVDTSDFIAHTTHPYAPFSTGAYNELVDNINGFEQFFLYWRRTRERAVDTLATGKHTEKSAVSTEVFDVDIPALEAQADGLLVETNGAAEIAIRAGQECLDDAKEADTDAREHIEAKLTKQKAKIFREIGFMVKKLYRATREEYKHRIKEDLEATITLYNEKVQEARENLADSHKNSIDEQHDKDNTAKAKFQADWVDGQMAKFDEFHEDNEPKTKEKLDYFHNYTMATKISTARATVASGLKQKERDIKAAYEAVKLKIMKIDDHHFQYNVRTLLEDAKAEADRRCAHEEVDTDKIIDGIEQWVWDFVEESTNRYDAKVQAEREALFESLNAAADRVWEESLEHQEIHEQHLEHEEHALEYFLKDCVKGLKHLFNRYGYVSPQFTEKHAHGYGGYHGHNAEGPVDAEKVVHTLRADPNNVHKNKDDDDDLKSWQDQGEVCYGEDCEAEEPEDESRSSCSGSSCADPHDIDHHHKEIKLDSLEDLANVIDDEIIHVEKDHTHGGRGHEKKNREYESFIKSSMVDSDDIPSSVDVSSVSAPTYEDVHPEYYDHHDDHGHGHDHGDHGHHDDHHDDHGHHDDHHDDHYDPHDDHHDPHDDHHDDHYDGHHDDHHDDHHDPYVPAKREKATYGGIALPDFVIPEYKPVERPKPEPKKIVSKPHVAQALKGGDEDIWGSYLAKYSKETESYKPVVKAPEPWKPRPYQAFDFSKYALKAREEHHDDGYNNDKDPYWWEDQHSERKPVRGNAPWWEEMTYDMDNDHGHGHNDRDDHKHERREAQHYKPTYKPYVPRSSYEPKAYTPRVSYQSRPLQKYWWQNK